MHPSTQNVSDFITRWQGSTASELPTAQRFVIELCELLGVPRPHATVDQAYMFERPVTFRHDDGSWRGSAAPAPKRLPPSTGLLQSALAVHN